MSNLNDWAGVWAITYTHRHLATKSGHEDHKANGRLPVLNVEFAERLMGFPVGWTELEPSEIPCAQTSPSSSEDV